jgi:hypothetical protein
VIRQRGSTTLGLHIDWRCERKNKKRTEEKYAKQEQEPEYRKNLYREPLEPRLQYGSTLRKRRSESTIINLYVRKIVRRVYDALQLAAID